MQSEKTQIYHCRWRDISCPDSVSWHVVGLCDMGWSSAAPPTPLTLLAMQLTESGYNVQQQRWKSILTQEKQKKKTTVPTYLEGMVSGELRSIIQECYHLLFSLSLFIVFCGNPVTVITTLDFFLAFTIQWIWKLLMLFKPHLIPVK